MKNTILSMLVLGLLICSSCKKVIYYPDHKKVELTTSNTITDKSLIDDQSVWTLVEVATYGNPDNRYFKFESNGKYVVSVKDIKDYYWKTNKFFEGSKHSGTFVKSLM